MVQLSVFGRVPVAVGTYLSPLFLSTAKSDIVGLLKRGLLDEIAFNKVKRGYIKGQRYDDIVKDLEFR